LEKNRAAPKTTTEIKRESSSEDMEPIEAINITSSEEISESESGEEIYSPEADRYFSNIKSDPK